MLKRRHMIAVIICAAMLLSIFVSSAYVVHEAAHHHQCTGEDCPICRFIARVEQLRRGFGLALMALLSVCFALTSCHERPAWAAEDTPVLCTLVGRKIRLND